MGFTIEHKTCAAQDGRRPPSCAINKWASLFFSFFLVWVFMFVVAPWIEKTPAVRPLAQFIEETGIDAGALYYTEIDETSEAEMYLHDSSEYTPVRN